MFVATYLKGWHVESQFSLEHPGRDIKYFPVCYGSQIGHPVLVMEEFLYHALENSSQVMAWWCCTVHCVYSLLVQRS